MLLHVILQLISRIIHFNKNIELQFTNFKTCYSDFYLSVGNLTEFEMHIEPAYSEGTLVEFNCTASLDESHANIKGYYKKESESSFSEIEGSTSVIERNLSHCFVKVLWKPSTPFTADTSFNNADLKCELVDWPLVQRTKKISVQNAGTIFDKDCTISNTLKSIYVNNCFLNSYKPFVD